MREDKQRVADAKQREMERITKRLIVAISAVLLLWAGYGIHVSVSNERSDGVTPGRERMAQLDRSSKLLEKEARENEEGGPAQRMIREREAAEQRERFRSGQ